MRYFTQDQSILTKCKFGGGGAYQLGTGALFGGGGAPITGGGAQIIGGGAGLRRAPAQFNPCVRVFSMMTLNGREGHIRY